MEVWNLVDSVCHLEEGGMSLGKGVTDRRHVVKASRRCCSLFVENEQIAKEKSQVLGSDRDSKMGLMEIRGMKMA